MDKQEAIEVTKIYWDGDHLMAVPAVPPSKQKPDAFLFNNMTWTPAKSWTTKVDGGTPVYGSPPSKPWVSLGREDILREVKKIPALETAEDEWLFFAEAYEAKLKELNT